jgi:hypothetical protein
MTRCQRVWQTRPGSHRPAAKDPPGVARPLRHNEPQDKEDEQEHAGHGEAGQIGAEDHPGQLVGVDHEAEQQRQQGQG